MTGTAIAQRRHTPSRPSCALRPALAILLALIPSTAASASGTVAGNVVDDANEPIQYALVTCVRTDDPNVITGDVTDQDGTYEIGSLGAGSFSVRMVAVGFAVMAEPNVVVTDGNTTTVDFQGTAEARITGRVTETDGVSPIGDVLVRTTVEVSGALFHPSTSSDPNTGEYVLTNLPAGTYTVEAHRQLYAFTSETVTLAGGEEASGVDLLGTSGWIGGTLTEWDQVTPIASVYALLFDPNGGAIDIEKTDPNGVFLLGPLPMGTYRLEFRLQDEDLLVAHTDWIVVEDDEVTDTGVVQAYGGQITGTIRDAASGQPVSNAQVLIRGTTPLCPDGIALIQTATDQDGDYVADRLGIGEFEIEARASGYAASRRGPVAVLSGQHVSDQDLDLGLGGCISGTIRDPSAQPVPEAVVVAGLDPNSGDPNDPNWAFCSSAVTDANGVYTIIGCRPEVYSLRASAEGFVSMPRQGVVVVGGQTTSGQDITLGSVDGAGTISGTVYGPDGQTPFPEACVYADAPDRALEYTITLSDGTYTLAPLSPGTYTVHAAKGGYGSAARPDVVVEAGQETPGQDLTVPSQ